MDTLPPSAPNTPAKGIPYFTPVQDPPSGTAKSTDTSEELPKIFQPLQIRGIRFQNRIWVSPMCQFSAENGFSTPWHLAHLGGIFTRGPGFTMMEATSVLPNGGITPEDCGIWSDDYISSLAQIVTFAHSQSQKIGLQLAHAGRKGSTVAPWLTGIPTASKDVGGWPDNVWGPSAIPFDDGYPHPKEMTKDNIKQLVSAFGAGAKRAVKAGFDVVEVHGAHGYLINQFLSPTSNKRTDEYGGSWENRIRLLLEVVDKVRSVIPDTMPLFTRISATEWLEVSLPGEPSWTKEDSDRLAPILYAHGVDLLDVSTGGNHHMQKIIGGPGYQSPFAKSVMCALSATSCYPPPSQSQTTQSNKPPSRLLVGTVGSITSGLQADKLLQDACADVIFVGRHFLRDPSLVWDWAEEFGDVDVQLASQIRWCFKGRGKKTGAGKGNT